MRPRHLAALAILALLWITNFAEAIFTKAELASRVPEWVRAVMNWLTDIDVWLLSNNIEPLIVGLSLTVILSGWIVPDIWPFLRKHLVRGSIGAFSTSFKGETADPRHDFRVSIEQAYRNFFRGRHNIEPNSDALVRLVDQVKFPNDFPPPEHEPLSGYMGSAKWSSDEIDELRQFLSDLYRPALNAGEKPLLPGDSLQSFMRALNRASKFWDDCAREIRAGRLTSASVKRQLDSNARDIKLMALSELVIAENVPWDIGGGKTNLFYLAKEGSALKKAKSRHWWSNVF